MRFIREPQMKRSFVLPVDPGEAIPEGLDLRYSGYSSIHYQITLGENSDASDELKGLQVEFQLRTILEEAWGEIDHKYRYVLSRSGVELPDHIHSSFYNLSAYLQAAALQAEHICRQAEAYRLSKTRRAREKPARLRLTVARSSYETGVDETDPKTSPLALHAVLEKTFGFKPARANGELYPETNRWIGAIGAASGSIPEGISRKTGFRNSGPYFMKFSTG